MSKAFTWSSERRGRARTDAVTLVIAVALHASLLIVNGEPPHERFADARMFEAPELEMAAGEEGFDEMEPLPEPEPAGDPLEPEIQEPLPEPVPDVEEAPEPEVPAEEITDEVEDLPASDEVMVDESAESTRFGVRTGKPARGSKAVGDPKFKKHKQRRGRRHGKRNARRGAFSSNPKYPRALDALVSRNYPRFARSEGVEANVVALVKLSATGRVLNVRVSDVSDDGWGFGEACVRSIHQLPQWKPKYQVGRAVATTASYTCRFGL